MAYVLDGARASRQLASYLRRNCVRLEEDVGGVCLDSTQEKATTELCYRISANPNTTLGDEPVTIRALLAARLTIVLAVLLNHPEARLKRAETELSDDEVVSFVFGQMVSKTRLPLEWNEHRLDRRSRYA